MESPRGGVRAGGIEGGVFPSLHNLRLILGEVLAGQVTPYLVKAQDDVVDFLPGDSCYYTSFINAYQKNTLALTVM